MLLVNQKLSNIFQKTVQNLYTGKEIGEISITPVNNEKFGDYQCNFAMMNSKVIEKKPIIIAEEIQQNLVENDVIEKLEIAGPGFINIFLKESFLDSYIQKIGKEEFDFSFLNLKGDVIVDFSYLGYHVIGDNHIGDWGTQFGKLIVGYHKWLDQKAYEENPIEELERIYLKFSQEAEGHPELEDEARHELKKLQDGEEENYNLWKEFLQVSLEEYGKLYKRLDVHFDTFYGESFYHPIMPKVVEELVKKGIAREDDGAKVVFFPEEDKLFPCIVQKKDGTFLYTTSDIATIKFRSDTYDVNHLVYLTDERQQDHFKQVFRITDMLGWDIEKYHVWFGIMRFGNETFSTRKGNVIHLEELLDEGKKRAYETVQQKNPSLSEEEKQHIAEVVGIGAIKYADLSQNRQSPIVFEWDKILSFEGNTAPYLQYSYARIQSILNKAKELGKEIQEDAKIILQNKHEKSLATYMTIFPLSVLKAAETYKPNFIADYLYDLCKKINSFYNNCPILNQEDEILQSRACLAKKAGILIQQGLSLLGIKTLERM